MAQYRNDPRWITAKFTSTCAGADCGATIAKGDRLFWYPRGRKGYCATCGEQHAADFAAAVADEEFNNCL